MIISQKPSFYQAFIMDQPHLKQLFYEKLSPEITPNIFDNAKNAQIFIKKALKIYNENVTEISQNIAKSKSTWKDSGFDLLTYD